MKALLFASLIGASCLLASQSQAMTASNLSGLRGDEVSAAIQTGWHTKCWWSHGHKHCKRWH